MLLKTKSLIAATLLALPLATGSAHGQNPPAAAPAAAQPAAAPALPVASFVDETTLMVAEVDVSAVDLDALAGWFQTLLKQAGLPQKDLDEVARDIGGGTGHAKGVLAAFGQTGARKAYVVAMMNQQAPFFVVVPTGAGGADAAKLKQFLSGEAGGLPKEITEAMAAEQVGDAVVWGLRPGVAMAKETHANAGRQARPELAAAFAAAGNAPVRLAFAPPEAVKGLLGISQPRLPAELGGGATGPIVNAFRSLTWAADLPTAASPKAAVRITIQAKDAEGAKRLMGVVESAFAAARKEPGFREVPDAERMLAMMTPQVAGDRLTLQMDQPKLEAYAKAAVPSLTAARAQATRVRSMSNLKQQAVAVHMYATDKGGNLPANYPDDLKPYLGADAATTAQVLSNPAQPGKSPGYVYVRPAGATKMADVKESATTPLIHEAYDAWPAGGIHVAFVDGHVELVKDEAAFKKMLGAK